jgi:hypothetical protein
MQQPGADSAISTRQRHGTVLGILEWQGCRQWPNAERPKRHHILAPRRLTFIQLLFSDLSFTPQYVLLFFLLFFLHSCGLLIIPALVERLSFLLAIF